MNLLVKDLIRNNHLKSTRVNRKLMNSQFPIIRKNVLGKLGMNYMIEKSAFLFALPK